MLLSQFTLIKEVLSWSRNRRGGSNGTLKTENKVCSHAMNRALRQITMYYQQFSTTTCLQNCGQFRSHNIQTLVKQYRAQSQHPSSHNPTLVSSVELPQSVCLLYSRGKSLSSTGVFRSARIDVGRENINLVSRRKSEQPRVVVRYIHYFYSSVP